jgi:hypothetical protein
MSYYTLIVFVKVDGRYITHRHSSDKYDVINLFHTYKDKYNLPYEIKPSDWDLFLTDDIMSWGFGSEESVIIEKL